MIADSAETPVAPLPVGTVLDRYRIEQLHEHSDHFSLLYRARDTISNTEVLLREFAPAEFVVREGNELRPRSEDVRRTVHWGLRGFADQAAGLQSLRQSRVVQILHVFEANGTAYYATTPLSGETLAARLEREQTLPSNVLIPLVDQLLEALAQIHAAGLLHWDIRPEHILIDSAGAPWLVDFGAARFVMRFKFRSIYTVIVPGYAPPEVYSAAAHPGAVTDLYSLAATIYRAIGGAAPPDSQRLSRGETTLAPALKTGYGRFPAEFLKAVDWGLRLDAEQRPKSAAEWREALAGRMPVPAATKSAAPAPVAHPPAVPVTAAPAPAAVPTPPAPTATTPSIARDTPPPAARAPVAEAVLPGPAPDFRPNKSPPLRIAAAAGAALLVAVVVIVLATRHKDSAAPAAPAAATTVAKRPPAEAPLQAPAAAPAPAPIEQASPSTSSNIGLDQIAAGLNRGEVAAAHARERAAVEQARERERAQRELAAANEQEKASHQEQSQAQQAPANRTPATETVRAPAQTTAPMPVAKSNAPVQQPTAGTTQMPAQTAATAAPAPTSNAQTNGATQQPAAQTPTQTANATPPSTAVAASAKPSGVRVAPARDPSHSCAPPQYPSSSRFAGDTGTTVVELLINTDGTVGDSRIATSSGHRDLDQAARSAFSHCKWKPGTLDGKPEAARLLVKMSWQLQ
jgi:TonB family protein